jgi:tetratricopeptide (TPR) repeat protein
MDLSSSDPLAAAAAAQRAGDVAAAERLWAGLDLTDAAWANEARRLDAAGDTAVADAMILAATARLPDFPGVQYERALRTYLRGELSAAAPLLAAVGQRFPGIPDAWVLAMRAWCRLGRLDEAQAVAQAASLAAGRFGAVLMETAHVAELRGDVEAVQEICARVRAAFPPAIDAIILELRTLQRARRFAAAQALCEQARAAGLRHPGLDVAEASLAEASGDLGRMLDVARALRAEHPHLVDGHALLLRGLLASGDSAALEEVLQGAPDAVAQSPEFAKAGCLLALRRRQPDAAEALAREAIGRFPGHGELHSLAAMAMRQAGRNAEAEVFLLTHVPRFPREARLLIEFAAVAEALGRPEESVQRWAQLRAGHPGAQEGYTHAARLLVGLGRYDEAEAVAADGLARFPDDQVLAVQQATIATRRQDWPTAVRLWQDLTARFPDSLEVANGAGGLRVAMQLAEMEGQAVALRLTDVAGISQAARLVLAQAGITDLPSREFFLGFEGLGDNCAFGGLQRIFGAEPLGLLRWTNVAPAGLAEMLERRFEGVGLAENTYVTVNPVTKEYYGGDRRYFQMHTFTQAQDVPDAKMHAQMCRRLKFLADKLVEDLEAGEKIFVYNRSEGPLSDPEIARLEAAMALYGRPVLLCIRGTDDAEQNATVAQRGPRLFVAAIHKLDGNPNHIYQRSPDYVTICRAVRALVEAQA